MLWTQMSLAGSFSWGSPLGGLFLLRPEVVGFLCQLPPESSMFRMRSRVCGDPEPGSAFLFSLWAALNQDMWASSVEASVALALTAKAALPCSLLRPSSAPLPRA